MPYSLGLHSLDLKKERVREGSPMANRFGTMARKKVQRPPIVASPSMSELIAVSTVFPTVDVDELLNSGAKIVNSPATRNRMLGPKGGMHTRRCSVLPPTAPASHCPSSGSG